MKVDFGLAIFVDRNFNLVFHFVYYGFLQPIN